MNAIPNTRQSLFDLLRLAVRRIDSNWVETTTQKTRVGALPVSDSSSKDILNVSEKTIVRSTFTLKTWLAIFSAAAANLVVVTVFISSLSNRIATLEKSDAEKSGVIATMRDAQNRQEVILARIDTRLQYLAPPAPKGKQSE